MHDNFLFFELQGLTPGKPFPGFAAGKFVDMLGREIELKASDLQDFITNTLNKIKEYQGKGMPGLPIDASKHDKGDAAGWIVDVERESGEVIDSAGTAVPVIRILAEWTQIGVQKLTDKVQTNFSPTIDLDNKTIAGGSLTNWPASVDGNGIPLFTAVELSQGIHYLQANEPPTWARRLLDKIDNLLNHQAGEPAAAVSPEPIGDELMTIELTQEQLDQLVDGRVKEALTELEKQRPADTADLSQLVEALGMKADDTRLAELAQLVQHQADLKWQAKLADMQRETRYAELSARLTGGTAEAPQGIPVKAETLKDELMKLTPDQASFWAGVLETTVKNGLSDFSELGHGRRVSNKQAVPDYAVPSLKAAIAAGNDPNEFFALAGLGAASDYDLSAYIKEDK